MRILNTARSLLDFNRAIDLIGSEKYDEAEERLARAIIRTGDSVLHVHVLRLKLLAGSGKNIEASKEYEDVVRIMNRRNFNMVTNNYIRYYMICVMTDDQIDMVEVGNLMDPKILGIDGVSRPYARIFPYMDPRPRVKVALTSAGLVRADGTDG